MHTAPPEKRYVAGMRITIGLAFAALIAFGSTASANLIQPISLSKKLAQSDLVVTGIAEKTTVLAPLGVRELTPVHITAFVKGKSDDIIIVVTKGSIDEEDLGSLCPGATYILFLQHGLHDGYYYPVHGRGSALRADRSPPATWDDLGVQPC